MPKRLRQSRRLLRLAVAASALLVCSLLPAAPALASTAGLDWKSGLAFTAWWNDAYASPASDQSLAQARATGADWVELIPTEYMASASANQIAPSATKTPSLQSLQHAISRAHQLGMKVLLKPHVDVNDGTWRGQIGPSAPDAWFNSYTQFIGKYADLAQAAGADELAVGTELATMSGYAPQWRQVVATVRSRFSGPLTYAANWDVAERVSWWDALDYIGIDAYFPLSPNSASVSDLVASWQPWVAKIDALRRQFGMQVVFTELGYQSAAGSTRTPWWTGSSTVDLAGQANAYEAAFDVWSKIQWFRGFFWWDWSYVPGAAGQPPTGFSPQGKPAQQVLESLESWQRVFPTTFIAGINAYGSR